MEQMKFQTEEDKVPKEKTALMQLSILKSMRGRD